MKKVFLCFSVLIPFLGIGQTDSIHFQKGMRWEDVLQLAKSENKYIFVDCYATWCGPCKEMDQHVYNSPMVATYVNEHFISLKLQVDSAKGDADDVRLLYGLAKDFSHRYRVKALPTLLFFSPDGEAVHKVVGSRTDSEFVHVAANALNPEKQYYTQVRKFQAGSMQAPDLMKLAGSAKDRGDDSLAGVMARYYMEKYWDVATGENVYDKESLDFLSGYAWSILTSKDKMFRLVYDHGQKVDSVIDWPKFSHGVICFIIEKEMVNPQLDAMTAKDGATPDWKQLTKSIANKYNKVYAAEAVVNGQISWYKKKKDFANIAKYKVKRYQLVGIDTAGIGRIYLNNDLFESVFKHSTNKGELLEAAGWMKIIAENYPKDAESMDTYANLLYKAGKTTDAISWEEKAAELQPKSKELQDTYAKMKAGLPTWQ